MPTVGKVDLAEVTFRWIANSLELNYLKLSENLLPQIEKNRLLEIVGPPEEFAFDKAGDLGRLVLEGATVAH